MEIYLLIFKLPYIFPPKSVMVTHLSHVYDYDSMFNKYALYPYIILCQTYEAPLFHSKVRSDYCLYHI